jgi:hypothetical protein
MKKVLAFFLFLTLAACKKDDIMTLPTLTGEWKLVKLHDFDQDTVFTEPSDVWHSIIMKFSDDGKEGTFRGYTTGTEAAGTYRLSDGTNGAWKMNVLTYSKATFAIEQLWGLKFDAIMPGACSYEIKGNKMFIYWYCGHGNKMEWDRVDAGSVPE